MCGCCCYFSNASLTTEQLETECCICHQPLSSSKCYRIKKCKHVYHKHCIKEWYSSLNNTYKTCPLCRTQIVPVLFN